MRCIYCMPQEYKGWAEKKDRLSADEIIKIICSAAELGVRKIRFTGGEPTIRADIVDIVRETAKIPGIECIGMSTNGSRLTKLAVPLRQAGLRTINISLDTIDPGIFHSITGGNLESVINGINCAIEAGFERIKLNCVLMRGINDWNLLDLVEFAGRYGLPIRLIELMPVSSQRFAAEKFISIDEAKAILGAYDELEPVPEHNLGWGPAKYYRLRKIGALVGFIGAMTQAHFCETCNKMRLTSDGKIRPCLGSHGEVDLLSILRNGGNEVYLQGLIEEAMNSKPLSHSFVEGYTPLRPMCAIGG